MKNLKPVMIALCFVVSIVDVGWAEDAELKTVEARTLKLKVPTSWIEKKPSSEMRVAQFSIAGEPSDAELIVFYFGGPTGGIKANVERWIGQFEKEGLELEIYEGRCDAGRYILVDCSGVWNKPDGPPFARKTIRTPDSRVLNVIVVETKGEQKDYYFMKLSGNQKVVSAQTDSLRAAIGADLSIEKNIEMKSLR